MRRNGQEWDFYLEREREREMGNHAKYAEDRELFRLRTQRGRASHRLRFSLNLATTVRRSTFLSLPFFKYANYTSLKKNFFFTHTHFWFELKYSFSWLGTCETVGSIKIEYIAKVIRFFFWRRIDRSRSSELSNLSNVRFKV